MIIYPDSCNIPLYYYNKYVIGHYCKQRDSEAKPVKVEGDTCPFCKIELPVMYKLAAKVGVKFTWICPK